MSGLNLPDPPRRRGSAWTQAPQGPACQVCGQEVWLLNGRLPWACPRCGAVLDTGLLVGWAS